ncbi:MAG: hypothetical protein ACI875_001082, partial [Planctomycetota bacterium]
WYARKVIRHAKQAKWLKSFGIPKPSLAQQNTNLLTQNKNTCRT